MPGLQLEGLRPVVTATDIVRRLLTAGSRTRVHACTWTCTSATSPLSWPPVLRGPPSLRLVRPVSARCTEALRADSFQTCARVP